MTKSVRFTKMHGAGNDYIYVDTQKYDVPDPSASAIAWSNRHTGIGSDGLVLIGKPYGGYRRRSIQSGGCPSTRMCRGMCANRQ